MVSDTRFESLPLPDLKCKYQSEVFTCKFQCGRLQKGSHTGTLVNTAPNRAQPDAYLTRPIGAAPTQARGDSSHGQPAASENGERARGAHGGYAKGGRANGAVRGLEGVQLTRRPDAGCDAHGRARSAGWRRQRMGGNADRGQLD